MPGVSMSTPPDGSAKSSRCVVVCRPRASASLTSEIRCASRPSIRFVRLDFPTPEDPMSTTDSDRPTDPSRPPTPSPLAALTRTTSTSRSGRSRDWTTSSASARTSALLMTITGRTPAPVTART
jgi:hypothetical protein